MADPAEKVAVGKRFPNFKEFRKAVEEYGKAINAVFTTADSKANKYLKLGCKHFGKPRVSSRGIRVNQKLVYPFFYYSFLD